MALNVPREQRFTIRTDGLITQKKKTSAAALFFFLVSCQYEKRTWLKNRKEYFIWSYCVFNGSKSGEEGARSLTWRWIWFQKFHVICVCSQLLHWGMTDVKPDLWFLLSCPSVRCRCFGAGGPPYRLNVLKKKKTMGKSLNSLNSSFKSWQGGIKATTIQIPHFEATLEPSLEICVKVWQTFRC